MRAPILALACLLAACGPSEVEVTEAQRATAQTDVGAKGAGEAPVDLGEGLTLTVLERGGGDFVRSGGRVRVHYTADVVAIAEAPKADEEGDDAQADDAPEAEGTGEEAADAPGAASDDDAANPEGDATEPPAGDPEASEETATGDEAPEAGPDAQEPELPRRFDSSRARGVPDVWDLSRTARPRLIEGLRRGLVGLTEGSRVTLLVPAALAWGDEGLRAANVPPRADVLYEIELLEVLP